MKPREIDTELAALYGKTYKINDTINRLMNRVLDHSGLRKYVSANHRTGKSSYQVTGTFEDGVALLEAHEAAWGAYRASGYTNEALRPAPLSNYAGSVNVAETVRDRKAAFVELDATLRNIDALDDVYRDHRWNRFFLVTSSAGHVHSSMHCHTCKPTTTYGWLPQLSGKSEEEAVEQLGTVLCSVCFPSAPVAHTGGKITKAKAAKLAA